MLIYASNFIDRTIVNTLGQPIKVDLGISDAQLGLLQGFAFAIFYTVLGLPIGRLAEHKSRGDDPDGLPAPVVGHDGAVRDRDQLQPAHAVPLRRRGRGGGLFAVLALADRRLFPRPAPGERAGGLCLRHSAGIEPWGDVGQLDRRAHVLAHRLFHRWRARPDPGVGGAALPARAAKGAFGGGRPGQHHSATFDAGGGQADVERALVQAHDRRRGVDLVRGLRRRRLRPALFHPRLPSGPGPGRPHLRPGGGDFDGDRHPGGRLSDRLGRAA